MARVQKGGVPHPDTLRVGVTAPTLAMGNNRCISGRRIALTALALSGGDTTGHTTDEPVLRS